MSQIIETVLTWSSWAILAAVVAGALVLALAAVLALVEAITPTRPRRNRIEAARRRVSSTPRREWLVRFLVLAALFFLIQALRAIIA